VEAVFQSLFTDADSHAPRPLQRSVHRNEREK